MHLSVFLLGGSYRKICHSMNWVWEELFFSFSISHSTATGEELEHERRKGMKFGKKLRKRDEKRKSREKMISNFIKISVRLLK